MSVLLWILIAAAALVILGVARRKPGTDEAGSHESSHGSHGRGAAGRGRSGGGCH